MPTVVKLTKQGKKRDVVEFLEFNTHFDAEVFIHSIPFMQKNVREPEFMQIKSAIIVK